MVAHEVHTLETWFDSNVRNQGASPPIKVIQVVLYTDLLFQLPPTLTSSLLAFAPAQVLDMRYVACGERPLKNK